MTTHLSDPILSRIGSYFLRMSKQDQEAFLYVWDQQIRVIAKLKRRMHEIDASKSLASLLPDQVQLNLPLILDLDAAKYVRGVARGRMRRSELPVPGSNRFTWPDGHVASIDVREGDRLLFESGARDNTNDFAVKHVDVDGVLTEEAFSPESGEDLVYRVDRGSLPDPVFVGCAEVHEIPGYIVSIPMLCTSVGPGGRTFVEGADYVILNGRIGFYDHLPRQFENGLSFLFAPEARQDADVAFNNFGLPIRFRRPSSEEYVRGLQALWFALWNGDAVNNVDVGVAVLFGLPFARPGTVESIARTPDGGYEIVVGSPDYRDVLYLPKDFPPTVDVGQEVGYQAITRASRVVDYIAEPGFIELFELSPRVLKFHTFFVVIGYDAIQSRLKDGVAIDFDAVVDFVDRIKSKRKDFHLVVEMMVRDSIGISAETPVVDAKLLAHSALGSNYANLMTIDSFGSPGFPQPHGYHDNYVVFSDGVGELHAEIVSARDGSDVLDVEWDGPIPGDDALVSAFVVELGCSQRASGSADFDGYTLAVPAASHDIARIRSGDTVLTDSDDPVNRESFQVVSVELSGTDIILTIDRSASAESGVGFEIKRFYPVAGNNGGRIRLGPATLAMDGLDIGNPGGLTIWRKVPGGETMRLEYESRTEGRVDFADQDVRDCFDFDSDAIELADRVKIMVLDKDDNTTLVHDQRDEDGAA